MAVEGPGAQCTKVSDLTGKLHKVAGNLGSQLKLGASLPIGEGPKSSLLGVNAGDLLGGWEDPEEASLPPRCGWG